MSRRSKQGVIAAALAALVATACSGGDAANSAEAAPAGDAASMAVADNVSGSMKGLYGMTTAVLKATAEKVPEDLYGFQPTSEVRTMGQILAHVAGAQFLFCSAAAGEQSPNSENFEETRTSKAQIIEALSMGIDYCNQVYDNMSDARGQEMIQFFGSDWAVNGVLAFNAAHNYEHYGNLVTYMRINGIVPPSSAGGM
ncbi:MAG: DinB family protein [Gemmatimonadota bacterium]